MDAPPLEADVAFTRRWALSIMSCTVRRISLYASYLGTNLPQWFLQGSHLLVNMRKIGTHDEPDDSLPTTTLQFVDNTGNGESSEMTELPSPGPSDYTRSTATY